MKTIELAREVIQSLPIVRCDTISASNLAVMLAIVDKPMPLLELAEALGIPQATASRFVDRAVEGGYVVRRVGEDARNRIVCLEPKGMRVMMNRRCKQQEG